MAKTNDMGPQIDLQWFAEEGGAGNPAEGSGEGAEGAGSFVTDLLGNNKAGDEGAGKPAGGEKPAAAAPAKGTPKQEAKEAPGAAKAVTDPLPGWTNATTKELRADPRFTAYAAKFKSFDDAVKSAMELDSKVGGMVSLPTEKSTPEEIAEFYQRFGVPEKPEDYDLEMSKDLEYTDDSLKEFRDLALALHLNKAQAKEMFAKVNERAKAELDAYNAKQTETRKSEYQACEASIRKEWGAEYDQKLNLAKRGLAAYADADFLEDMKTSGMGNHPSTLRLFAKLGEMVLEDTANFRQGKGGAPRTLEDRIYPKQGKE